MTSKIRKILLCQYENVLGFADRKPWIISIENQVEAKDLFKWKNKNFLLYETTASSFQNKIHVYFETFLPYAKILMKYFNFTKAL